MMSLSSMYLEVYDELERAVFTWKSMVSLISVYLEVYDELELGPALLLYDGCDGKLLHALQQAAHHW
jgi:hypothetical protein